VSTRLLDRKDAPIGSRRPGPTPGVGARGSRSYGGGRRAWGRAGVDGAPWRDGVLGFDVGDVLRAASRAGRPSGTKPGRPRSTRAPPSHLPACHAAVAAAV